MIQAVVFDLDGTLADTAALSTGQRLPAHVLGLCPPGATVDAVSFGPRVCALPGSLIARGIWVAVLTNSPRRYAATLLGLLNIDYCELYAGVSPADIANRLRSVAQHLEIDELDVLYVGDQTHDEDAARQAGVTYQQAPWLSPGTAQIHGITRPAVRCWAALSDDPSGLRSQHPIDQLCQTVRSATPIPDELIDRLCACDDLDPNLLGALCYVALLATPYQGGQRGRLQAIALEHMPPEARDCVVRRGYRGGWIGFPPQFLTRAELHQHRARRATLDGYQAALRRLFPLHRVHPWHSALRLSCFAVVPYNDCEWGDQLWINAKGWQGTRSGPEPITSLLDFPAAVLAAHLSDRSDDHIIPAPSTPFSAAQPAQTSLRLAHLTAAESDSRFLPVLIKTPDGIVCTQDGDGQEAVLLDDQITEGTTVAACVKQLRHSNWGVRSAYAWSASRRTFRDEWHDRFDQCWLEAANSALGTIVPCNSTAHRAQ